MNILKALSDNSQENSIANVYRKRRFSLFERLLSKVSRPIHIADIGGTESFWKNMGIIDEPGISVTILNLTPVETTLPNVCSHVFDATNLFPMPENHFDIAFSNSVIEHVGDFEAQEKMAKGIRHIAKKYFLQTPNYYFPIEPHFLFPGFQFLPVESRVFLVKNFNLGWVKKEPNEERARNIVDEVKLLTRADLEKLFPNSNIVSEKCFGLDKSFLVYGGWEEQKN